MSEQRDVLTEVIRSVTDLWDEPLDEVHDVQPIVNAILAAGFTTTPPTTDRAADGRDGGGR